MTPLQCAIIGSGVAGVTAARELAKAGKTIEIHLYNAEPVPYYPRPRLWEFIAGKLEIEKLFFQPEAWYAGQGITLHNDTGVSTIEPEQHQLQLSDGSRCTYDRLLLACGAEPFLPALPGSNLPGVYTLRTLKDARSIASHADTIDETVVIGGGLLGLETANSLRLRGKKVTVIEFATHLLPRQLDPQGSGVLRSYLENQGLEIITAAETESIQQKNNRLVVKLKDGRQIANGLVIFSTGIRPRLSLARQAGIESKKGVVVDDLLQTSKTDIFAAGDVCQYGDTVYGIIPAAMEQARIAAHNMSSAQPKTYRGTLPSTRLKIAGMEFNSLGDATGESDGYTVIRHENAGQGIYRRLNIKDGRVCGAILLGEQQIIQPIKMLINSKKDITPHIDKLDRPDFDFKALATEKTG